MSMICITNVHEGFDNPGEIGKVSALSTCNPAAVSMGMETVVSLYSDAMTEFEELCSDLKTWHQDAPKNAHLQQTLELLKTIA